MSKMFRFALLLMAIAAVNATSSMTSILLEDGDGLGVLIDHVRLVIIIDNSSNASPVWRQASDILEATARFFAFYDHSSLLANQTRFVVSIAKVPFFDDPLTATQMLCKRIQKETNLAAIILTDTTPTFRAFVDELSFRSAIPVIELFTVSSMAMLPVVSHFHFYMCDFLMPAVQEVIEAYKWNDMLLIYDTPLNLACVNQLLGAPKQKGQTLALAVTDDNVYEVVFMIKTKWQSVVAAFDSERNKRFLQLCLRMGILSADYTFIFINPDLHLNTMEEFAHNQPNITLFRFVTNTNFTAEIIEKAREFEEMQSKYKVLTPITPSKSGIKNVLLHDQEIQLSLPSAMMFDALLLVRTTLDNLLAKNCLRPWHETFNNAINCRKPRPFAQGKTVAAAMARQHVNGVTGLIKFNETTNIRDTFAIEILGLGNVGLVRIGVFCTEAVLASKHRTPGLTHQLEFAHDMAKRLNSLANVPFKPSRLNREGIKPAKMVIKVTTLLEKPYVMTRTDDSRSAKQVIKSRAIVEHRYEGYCVDLLEELAELMDFYYQLQPVADGRYGSYNATSGRWSGMVGEVVEGLAHIAVAPLTITYAREQAVDFTKPFINLGISILYVQPFKTNPSIFSFMQPLAGDVWIAVFVAFLVVTTVFIVIGQFADCIKGEQQEEAMEEAASTSADNDAVPNQPLAGQSKIFTCLNSAHFTIGGIVHHGSIIAPATIPTRAISVFWWFFALIIVSSYTANLAAFLTVETLASPFENAEELAKRTNILYGAVKGGSTENFFRESKIDTYRKMWAFMKDKDVFPKNNAEGINRVRRSKGGFAYLMESVSMDYIIANDNKDCQLRQVGSLLDSKGYGIATQKDSPIRDRLSMNILRLQENDRLQLLYDKWWKASGHSCVTDDSVAKVLEIQNVLGVFLILFTGIIFSFFALAIECLWYHRKRRDPSDTRPYFRRLWDDFRRPFQSCYREKVPSFVGIDVSQEVWHRQSTVSKKSIKEFQKLGNKNRPLKHCTVCHCQEIIEKYVIASGRHFSMGGINDETLNASSAVPRSVSLNLKSKDDDVDDGETITTAGCFRRPVSMSNLQAPQLPSLPAELPKYNKTRILADYSSDDFGGNNSPALSRQRFQLQMMHKSHSHTDNCV